MEDACVTDENYIIRRMFRWFRSAAPMRETAVAMVDPRPGNVLLVVGASNARLAAACAAVTGLNGRTVVVGRTGDDEKRTEAAAADTGALVEFLAAPSAMLPLDDELFDVIVIPDVGAATAEVVAEAMRVAKPAGRIVGMSGQRRAGIFGALQKPAQAPVADAMLALLRAAGGVAVRKLASVDGVSYFEARKPR